MMHELDNDKPTSSLTLSAFNLSPNGNLTNEDDTGVHRMRTGQLGLLAIFGTQNVPDIIEKLLVGLLGVLAQNRHESIAHGTRCRSGFLGVGTSLRVLAATPRDDISGTGPCGPGILFCLLRIPRRSFDKSSH